MLLRRRRAPNTDETQAAQRFRPLPYDEAFTVPTDFGVDLYVEVVDPVDGVDLDFGAVGEDEPTLVFIHGFCLDMGTFHFQRAELTRQGEYRMVLYDQPGHGRSGKLAEGEYTLEDLADGLIRVHLLERSGQIDPVEGEDHVGLAHDADGGLGEIGAGRPDVQGMAGRKAGPRLEVGDHPRAELLELIPWSLFAPNEQKR